MTDNLVKFSLSYSTTTASKRPWHKRYTKELASRRLTLPTSALVLYAIAIAASNEFTHEIAKGLTTNPKVDSVVDKETSIDVYYPVTFVRSLIHLVLYITMGWVSDTKLGRERAIGISLWSSWIGALLEVISLCIQYNSSAILTNIAKYGISSASILFLLFGSATFFVNVIAYGLDQLVDESSTRIRAFVHWLVWGLFVGFGTGFLSVVNYSSTLNVITGLIIFVIMSLSVSINTIYFIDFKPSGILKDNPYRLVVSVIVYACKHKHMSNRSAFTYWEDEIPNRISMAKQKYGGPFPDEAVENVKTFLRIIVICLAMFGFYIPFFVTYGRIEVNQFKGSTETLHGYGSYALWSACDKMIIILVPLYEIVLVPLFPKVEYFFLNPLRWLGISYIFLFLSLLSSFALDVAGEIVTPYNVHCTSDTPQFNVSFLYFSIPLFFYGLADIISLINGLEFIGSQSPTNISGMLTGAFWFVRGIYTDIGHIITISFSYLKAGSLSCNFWVLLIQIVICIGGFFIYIKAARWYQNRIRNDESVRSIVERKFTSRLSTREGETAMSNSSGNGSITGQDNDDFLEEYIIETITDSTKLSQKI